MTFAHYLTANMERCRLNFRELSEQTGLSISFLNDLKNRGTEPSLATALKLAAVFGENYVIGTGDTFEITADERRLIEAYREGNLAGAMTVLIELMEQETQV